MIECKPCDTRVSITQKDSCSDVVEINVPCCEEYLFTWNRLDTRDNFIFDEYCLWDDDQNWDDAAFFYECCKFDVYTTCIPAIDTGAGWYDTNNVVPYVMGNGFLYGVNEPS